jgi:Nucleotidyl transferase AbiEii toxin, Type IV TA system
MIPHSHFTRIADKQNVDAKTVERDYVLTHVLAAISLHPGNHGMVFKGGTALRLCYFEDYRYSADLDFSLQDDTDPQEALDVVKTALRELAQRIGFPHLALTKDEKHIEYTGPLGKQRDLKLDIATDELIKERTTLPLLARYPRPARCPRRCLHTPRDRGREAPLRHPTPAGARPLRPQRAVRHQRPRHRSDMAYVRTEGAPQRHRPGAVRRHVREAHATVEGPLGDRDERAPGSRAGAVQDYRAECSPRATSPTAQQLRRPPPTRATHLPPRHQTGSRRRDIPEPSVRAQAAPHRRWPATQSSDRAWRHSTPLPRGLSVGPKRRPNSDPASQSMLSRPSATAPKKLAMRVSKYLVPRLFPVGYLDSYCFRLNVPVCSYSFRVSDGTRTRDRLDHNQELYQLSYAHHVWRAESSVGRLAPQRHLRPWCRRASAAWIRPGRGTRSARARGDAAR